MLAAERRLTHHRVGPSALCPFTQRNTWLAALHHAPTMTFQASSCCKHWREISLAGEHMPELVEHGVQC